MRLIIDTDTAGDDCFSILVALAAPQVRLEALTICNGNIAFAQQVENALLTLDKAGAGGAVPVYAGCPAPMLRAPVDAAYVFGQDGMSDHNYPPAAQRPETRHAVDALIDLVMANPGEIAILAQAPLTNIAMAAIKHPGFAAAVRHLWIMGGTDNAIGNVTPAAEFNFYVDPEAARIVFRAGFAISLVTWTVTLSHAYLTPAELEAITRKDTPLARFFTEVNAASVAFSEAQYGVSGSLHPDSLTCACAIDESLILDSAQCFVDIETDGTLTRGYCSVSSPSLPDPELADPALAPARAANARLIRKVDSARFVRMLAAALD